MIGEDGIDPHLSAIEFMPEHRNQSRCTNRTSNDGFAWQLGAGFNYEASPDVNVGLDYRYFVGPEFKAPFGDFGDGGENSFGTLDNDNHAVMVHLNVDIN